MPVPKPPFHSQFTFQELSNYFKMLWSCGAHKILMPNSKWGDNPETKQWEFQFLNAYLTWPTYLSSSLASVMQHTKEENIKCRRTDKWTENMMPALHPVKVGATTTKVPWFFIHWKILDFPIKSLWKPHVSKKIRFDDQNKRMCIISQVYPFLKIYNKWLSIIHFSRWISLRHINVNKETKF